MTRISLRIEADLCGPVSMGTVAVIRTIAEHVVAGRLTLDHEAVPLDRAGEAWTRQANGSADRRIVLVP